MASGNEGRLEQWALARGQAAAIDLDPAYSNPDEIAAERRDIRFKAEFTAGCTIVRRRARRRRQ